MKFKNIYVLFFLCFFNFNLKAQSNIPKRIAFQSILRDNSNTLLRNTQVGSRFSIIQGTIFGSSVYVETHAKKTNNNGLFTVNIGEGAVVFGDINQLNWLNGPYFIKTEFDPSGGTNYTISNVTELLSVPFALASINADTSNTAKTAQKVDCIECIELNNIKLQDLSKILKDTSDINEIQTLTIKNDSIHLSKNGSTIKLPDADSTNELQVLRRNLDTVFISNGNYILLTDIDSLNEIQHITKSKDSLFLSKNGGFIKLTDDDTLNEIQNFQISHDTLRLSKSSQYVILGNKDQDTLDGVVSALGDAVYTGTYSINTSTVLPSGSTSTDLSCHIDLGNNTWIFGFQTFTPFGILNFNANTKSITKLKDINSNLKNYYSDIDKIITADAGDTSFSWLANGQIIVYKAKDNTYSSLPPSGSSNSGFFSNLTLSETPTSSQYQLMKMSKHKDTILMVFQKGDPTDFNYYFYYYFIKNDQLLPLDSFELTQRNGTKMASADFSVIGVESVMCWGDFKPNGLSSRFLLSAGILKNLKKKDTKLLNFPPYPQVAANFNSEKNFIFWNGGLTSNINAQNGLIKNLVYSKQVPSFANNGLFVSRSTVKRVGNLIKSNGRFYLLGNLLSYGSGDSNGYIYSLKVD